MTPGTALILASFGTTHLDALEHCITATERRIAAAFPELRVYRAFTSPVVRRRLIEHHQYAIPDLAGAVACARQDGFSRLAIQPTHLLQGIEYEKLLTRAAALTDLQLVIGQPLLTNEADCQSVAGLIMQRHRLNTHEALVLVGHGTPHPADAIYQTLQDAFLQAGYPAVVGTIDGRLTFEHVQDRLIRGPFKKARLQPLLFVAGDHAKNDLAGTLAARIRQQGLDVEISLEGLGAWPEISALYGRRITDALHRLSEQSA